MLTCHKQIDKRTTMKNQNRSAALGRPVYPAPSHHLMVQGKLPVPGRPIIWMIVGQGPVVLAVGAGGGCLDILLSSIFSLLFLPLFGRRPGID